MDTTRGASRILNNPDCGQVQLGAVALQWFIPAWAGNTFSPISLASSAPVHPRVGGEHIV